MKLTRRQFTESLAKVAGVASLSCPVGLYAAPPKKSSGGTKVPTKALPPLSVNFVPGVFFNRYADLGGVLDVQTGIIWGHEVFGGLINAGASFSGVLQIDATYKTVLLERATSGVEAEQPIYAAAYAIAAQRTWRAPTVFEARDAVQKGLFTFGLGGCNLYYSTPVSVAPGVAYGLANLRWSTSATPNGLVHIWSALDGGTRLTSKTSSLMALVVSQA